MTKPIVSTAAMQLIEKKQLDLDDDVSNYIPEWKESNFINSLSNKSITIKARGRAADNSYSDFTSNFVAYVAPGPTTGLAASSVSQTGMTISWTAPTGGVKTTGGYRLYHGTNSTWNNNANFDTAIGTQDGNFVFLNKGSGGGTENISKKVICDGI